MALPNPSLPKVCQVLKERRELKRVSHQMIQRETKISARYLEAMETGDWGAFPAEVYRIGFLKRYASYLGVPQEEILQLYQSEIQALQAKKAEEGKQKISEEKKEKSEDLLRLAVLVLLIALVGGWWLFTVFRSRQPARTRPAPVSVKKLEHATLVEEGPLTLSVRPTHNVWVRVTADRKLAFEGFLPTGSDRSWRAEDEVVLRVGNANLVQVSVNGRPVDATIGAVQAVNELVFDRRSLASQPDSGERPRKFEEETSTGPPSVRSAQEPTPEKHP